MAKNKKPAEPQRSFGEVLADIRDLQERYGRVSHFLRMAGYLFEAIELDTPPAHIKEVAAKVKEAYDDALAAVRATEDGEVQS